MDLKKKKKIHFRQDRQRNNQKYGELVALRVCVWGGGENRAYFCLGPFLQISELSTVTRLTDRIKKRLPG